MAHHVESNEGIALNPNYAASVAEKVPAAETSFAEVVDAFAAYLPHLAREPIHVFAPTYNRYLQLLQAWSARDPENAPRMRQRFFRASDAELSKGRLHPRARSKPLGYAGDYLLIDWIHTNAADSSSDGAR